MSRVYVTVNIGGTWCRVLVFDSPFSVEPLRQMRFKMSKHDRVIHGNFTNDFHQLVRLIGELTEDEDIAGISVAIAGLVDEERLAIIFAGNIKHWVGQPIVRMLEEAFDKPVFLVHDGEALALAEEAYGLGARKGFKQDFIAVVWGSGVGGGCIRYRDEVSFVSVGCEFGHVPVEMASRLTCNNCDNPGHLEALCGGDNLPERFGILQDEVPSKEQMEEVALDMVRGLVSILDAQPVRLIVMSGGVILGHPWMLGMIEELLDNPRYRSPRVVMTAVPSESPESLGALSLMRHLTDSG